MAKQLTATEKAKADRFREFFDTRDEHHIFWVKFIKRSTGEERVMLCRRAVKKYVKGVELDRAQTDAEIGCLTVFDMDVAKTLPEDERNKAYRRISLENILAVRMDGEEWIE